MGFSQDNREHEASDIFVPNTVRQPEVTVQTAE